MKAKSMLKNLSVKHILTFTCLVIACFPDSIQATYDLPRLPHSLTADADHFAARVKQIRSNHWTDRFATYIVKFKQDTHNTEHASLTHSFANHVASKLPYSAQVVHTYDDTRVFWGASFRVDTSGHDKRHVAQILRKLPNVEGVWVDRQLRLMDTRQSHTHPSAPKKGKKSNPNTKSPALPPHIGKRLPNGPFNNTFWAHFGNGAAEQHRLGNFGTGVRVCTMDTGVDYSVPSLNGGKPAGTPCFGPGCQVVGGYDLIGDPFIGELKPKPLDYRDVQNGACDHGTHTAGTIIANNTEYPGVVPQAELVHYKIFACSFIDPADNKTKPYGGGGFTSIVLEAYSRALKDKCDVLSASIGSEGAWAEDPTSEAGSNLGKHIPVLFSQGNSGNDGSFTAGEPASGDNVVSVAAGASPVHGTWAFHLASDPEKEYGTHSESPFFFKNNTDTVLSLWVPPKLASDPKNLDHGCDLEEVKEWPKLPHTVALLSIGGCNLYTKMDQIYNHTGALAFLVIPRWQEPLGLGNPEEGDPYERAFVDNEEGYALREAWPKNKHVKVMFPHKPAVHLVKSLKPQVPTTFTSWGPLWDLKLKPQIIGTGSSLLSAGPLPASQMFMSGTSMSCPMVAGLFALYRSLKKEATASEVRSAFMLSAAQHGAYNTTELAPALRQGAGWADVTAALAHTTLTEPHQLELLDTLRFRGTHKFTIFNKGKDKQKYTFGLRRAQCVYAWHKGAPKRAQDPDEGLWMIRPEQCHDSTHATFEPATLEVEPGKKGTVTVKFQAMAPDARLKLYSGWIKIVSDKDPTAISSLPYFGAAGDLESVGPWDQTFSLWNTTLPALYNDDLTTQIQNATTKFTINVTDPFTYPGVFTVAALGSRKFSCDLIQANLPIVATQGIIDDKDPKHNRLNESEYGARSVKEHEHKSKAHHPKKGAYAKFKDVPVVLNYLNETLISRDFASPSHQRAAYTLFGCFLGIGRNATGDVDFIHDGHYRVLLRQQKIFSASEDESSFWSYLSHPFHVKTIGNRTSLPHKSSGPDE